MNEMRELIDKLNYHTKLYDEGHPVISDKEWDDMYFELVKLERIYGYCFDNSPTQKISYQVVNGLKKIEHSHKMLSLQKTKDIEELKEFLGNHSYVMMPKLDGLTCSLTYEDGRLISAETRGNGIIGEDILHNALVIPSIPKKINYTKRLVIDGEIVCSRKDFKQFEQDYKNPRNFAAGSIRLLDSKECEKRCLKFVAWEVVEGLEGYNLFSLKLMQLFELGFLNVAFLTSNLIDNLNETIEKVQAEKSIYPTDGLVFKFDEVEYGKSLGETAHHFNNAIRYKFYDEEYDTNIKSIEWDVGRTGVLTPVAVFEPVEIDGTIVERASLHNISVMSEALNGGSYVGQDIRVYKSNMIIPQVVLGSGNPHVPEGAKMIPIPDTCPVCGYRTGIKKDNDTEFLFCANLDCPGKLINKLDHFCSKKGLDIKGLSKATLEKLLEWGWIKSITDIFKLDFYKNEWYNKNGFGKKSVDNILNAIEESTKNVDMNNFISAIGIPLVGTCVAKELAKHFSTYDNFRNNIINNDFDFSVLDGFGPELNKAIKNFNYEEADYIATHYVTFAKNKVQSEKTLNDLIFVITGSLNTYSNREELKTEIEKLGGKVSTSVSKNTSYLINNDVESNSSKNKKAKELNIPIISEQKFVEKFLTFN